VQTSFLPNQHLPLILQPAVDDVDLVAWAAHHRELIEQLLHKHGALLFRDFEVDSLSEFQCFTQSTAAKLMEYRERSSPRTLIEGYVYTSTDHPADQQILLHNEQSYTLEWPMKIWFYCLQQAARGGGTPIADSRRILGHLDSEIIEKFSRRQVMYVRTYGNGLGLPWQEVFQTSDPLVVEERCRRASIEFEWDGATRLKTRQIRPAIRQHRRTGETVWFNHALFFHFSSLPPVVGRAILAGVEGAELPFNTYYGDGSAIEPEVLDQIREAYRRETIGFIWQQGDILMLDNMLVAHGRESFDGPRKIAVVMGDPFSAA
jgi:alpha-ketoglutarate-dependent taurine dioxygenase